MPTISWFSGISIRMFFNDHAPPHFHAFHGKHEAKVLIASGEILSGYLPTKQARLVRFWALMYKSRLEEDWRLVRADLQPERIPGLNDHDN